LWSSRRLVYASPVNHWSAPLPMTVVASCSAKRAATAAGSPAFMPAGEKRRDLLAVVLGERGHDLGPVLQVDPASSMARCRSLISSADMAFSRCGRSSVMTRTPAAGSPTRTVRPEFSVFILNFYMRAAFITEPGPPEAIR